MKNYTDNTLAAILKPRSEHLSLNRDDKLVRSDGTTLVSIVHMYDDVMHNDARYLYDYQGVSSRLVLTREYVEK